MSFIHLPLSDSVLEIGICEGGEESVSMTFCFLRVFLGFFLPNDEITGGGFSHSFYLFESCDLQITSKSSRAELLIKKFHIGTCSF